MDITLRMSDHALTARAAAAAGIVLLKNTAGTLPLLPAEDGAPLPVAVFGIRQLLTPAYDRAMTPWRAIGVLDGLMASDAIRPDGLLARKYRTWAMEHPDGSELPLTNVDFGALRHDCAAAVVVIGRTPEQDHPRLTSEETAMLTRVTSVFDRTILVPLTRPAPPSTSLPATGILIPSARRCGIRSATASAMGRSNSEASQQGLTAAT